MAHHVRGAYEVFLPQCVDVPVKVVRKGTGPVYQQQRFSGPLVEVPGPNSVDVHECGTHQNAPPSQTLSYFGVGTIVCQQAHDAFIDTNQTPLLYLQSSKKVDTEPDSDHIGRSTMPTLVELYWEPT